MCRVNVTCTLEEQLIHIEESGHPDSLLYAAEGENLGPVAHQAWDSYVSEHPARVFHLQVQPSMPRWRLKEIERAAIWLLRQIFRNL